MKEGFRMKNPIKQFKNYLTNRTEEQKNRDKRILKAVAFSTGFVIACVGCNAAVKHITNKPMIKSDEAPKYHGYITYLSMSSNDLKRLDEFVFNPNTKVEDITAEKLAELGVKKVHNSEASLEDLAEWLKAMLTYYRKENKTI
jgi:hypothetical protein